MNDRFVPEKLATVSISDLNIERGYGIFDFFRLIGNHPLHLEDHLDRLFFSAEQMRLTIPKSREELKQVIRELIWKNEVPDSGIRIQITGGTTSDGIEFNSPTLIISQIPFSNPTPAQMKHGISLMSYMHQRQLPHVKSTDYLMSLWLQNQLKEQGAEDILYHDNGIIRECPRSNFFLVTQNDKVCTPEEGVLKGITRKKVLMLASKNFEVEVRNVRMEEIDSAREAFITSTTKQILPVTIIDRKKVGEGTPGKIAGQLMSELRAYCGNEFQNSVANN